MISLQNVSKEFKLDDKSRITPIQEINLDIDKGELIIITGRSGCGKSTLMNIMAGLIKPTRGKVMIGDDDLREMDQKQLSRLRSRKIGFIFQFPSLLPALPVIENVTLPLVFAARNGNGHNNDSSISFLKRVGLEDKLKAFPKQLSAGEQKRVAIARAFVNDPQIILADEPTSDLDNKTEHEIMEILKEANDNGVTFVIVTHSLQLVPYASRAFKMEDGKLVDLNKNKIINLDKFSTVENN